MGGGLIVRKHYIAAPSGLIATYTRRVSGTPLEDTFYFTHDHLGSIDSVTNQSGAVQVRLSFDAFGKRRKEAGWSGAVPSGDSTEIANTTRRGYTEHELLDNLTLTHMNGRVYDQTIGRFLSADPFVQAPDYSQSLNRYAYVWNNPLTLIDPSGFGAQITISAEQIADEASRGSSGSGGANILPISFGAYLWVTGGHIVSGTAGSSERPEQVPNDDPKESPPSERIQQGRPTDAGIPMPAVRDSTVGGFAASGEFSREDLENYLRAVNGHIRFRGRSTSDTRRGNLEAAIAYLRREGLIGHFTYEYRDELMTDSQRTDTRTPVPCDGSNCPRGLVEGFARVRERAVTFYRGAAEVIPGENFYVNFNTPRVMHDAVTFSDLRSGFEKALFIVGHEYWHIATGRGERPGDPMSQAEEWRANYVGYQFVMHHRRN